MATPETGASRPESSVVPIDLTFSRDGADEDHNFDEEDSYELREGQQVKSKRLLFPSEDGFEPLHRQFDDETMVRSYDMKRMSALSPDLEDLRIESIKLRSPRQSQVEDNGAPSAKGRIRGESGSAMELENLKTKSPRSSHGNEFGLKLRSSRGITLDVPPGVAPRSPRSQASGASSGLRQSRTNLMINIPSSPTATDGSQAPRTIIEITGSCISTRPLTSPLTPQGICSQDKMALEPLSANSAPSTPRRVTIVDRLFQHNGPSSPRKMISMNSKSLSKSKRGTVVPLEDDDIA